MGHATTGPSNYRCFPIEHYPRFRRVLRHIRIRAPRRFLPDSPMESRAGERHMSIPASNFGSSFTEPIPSAPGGLICVLLLTVR